MQIPRENYWLFFSQCILCRGHTQSHQGICERCHPDLPWITSHCPRCNLPQNHNHLCAQCLQPDQPIEQVFALFDYQFPIDQLITQVKYHNKPAYMMALSQLLIAPLTHFLKTTGKPDLLLPVPMHPQRLRERGYNQAEILAETIARHTGIANNSSLLIKQRPTAQQMSLSRQARFTNLKNAFECRAVPPKHVAIVDDVMTTGTTVREIAALLKRQGAHRVDVYTLVRTGAEH